MKLEKTVNKIYISIGIYNTIEARLAFLEFESN